MSQKLTKTLKLPDSCGIVRARLRLLRLTIPANLYSTGVFVEIVGIDIQLQVQNNKRRSEQEGRRQRPKYADNHHSEALPQHDSSTSPSLRYSSEHDEFEDNAPVPSSQDLATSFLRSEPQEERLELEAALSSQADTAQQSLKESQFSEGDLGIGPDGGFSLPTFLTGFFQGIADRLHVNIRDIIVCVALNGNEETQSQVQSPEPAPFMQALLKVDEICIDEVSMNSEASTTMRGKRHVSFRQASIEIISDFDEQPSTFNDRHKDINQNVRIGQKSTTGLDPLDAFVQTSSTLSMSSRSTLDNGTSVRRPPSDLPSDDEYSSSSPGRDEVTHQSLGSQQSSTRDSLSSIREDLAASRIFTREEADSMYMSAMSDVFGEHSSPERMPGEWSEDSAATPVQRPGMESGAVSKHGRNPRIKSGHTLLPGPYPSQKLPSRHSSGSVQSYTYQEQPLSVTRSALSIASSVSSKDLLRIDCVSIWLPMNRNSDQNNNSTTENLPAPEFSTTEIVQNDVVEHDVVVETSKIFGQIDLSSCRVLIRASKFLTTSTKPNPTAEITKPRQPPDGIPFRAKIMHVELSLYENAPERLDWKTGTSPAFASGDEPLFQLQVENANVSCPDSDGSCRELRLSRVKLVHGEHKLLSFDQGASLRESVRDISDLTDDIRVSLTSVNTTSNLEINALPVQISLDLPTIDDFLPRSGVLSSLLDIGSSLSTIGASTPTTMKDGQTSRSRNVRFEVAPQVELSATAESPSGKTNVRIQGLTLTLTGSETAVKFQTSAIKVVHRSEGVGLQVDRANLSGPYFNDWRQRPAVKFSLDNTRLEYLQSPRESDLDRLLAILSPSKGRFDEDDDIMLDTLLRQRRKGPVLRVTFDTLKTSIDRLSDLDCLPTLVSEMSRLSTVTKYLPEDDRPGILFLLLVKNTEMKFDFGGHVKAMVLNLNYLEFAHVSLPALSALKLPKFNLRWTEKDILLGEAIPMETFQGSEQLPMLMCKFIGDEMDPAIRVKLYNIACEYNVSFVMACLDLDGSVTAEELASNLASSIANLEKSSFHASSMKSKGISSPLSSSSHNDTSAQRLNVSIILKDCTLGLNPRGLSSKCLILFSEANVESSLQKAQSSQASLKVNEASVMVIDDIGELSKEIHIDTKPNLTGNIRNISHQLYLVKAGFVPVGSISSAAVLAKICHRPGFERTVDVEVRDNLLILETAADSMQTLINVFNGLQPPMPVSKVARYRTEVLPIEDMLASLSGDAFFSEPGPEAGLRAPSTISLEEEQSVVDDVEYVSEFYPPTTNAEEGDLSSSTDDFLDEPDYFGQTSTLFTGTPPPADDASNASKSLLEFQADHFEIDSGIRGPVHGADPSHDRHDAPTSPQAQNCPLRVHIRDVHVIWNLFDGYDWQRTRDQIAKAVEDVQQRANVKRDRTASRMSPSIKEEEDTFIGDCLFNSVYVGIPVNRDPQELTRDINRNIDDLISETGSHATTSTITPSSPRPHPKPGQRAKKLRLTRSNHHKMAFELSGINADFVVFADSSNEVQSSLDLRIRDLVVFDHVPTSTWKKFATYMLDAGERESSTYMVHIQLSNVKPVPDLAATEIVLKISVLPLRLHVDQDALDFMSRFFEFKYEGGPSTQTLPPFFQRVEVNPVKVKLDFKPKRVDYGGLRSGRTTEFMNFFVLDAADMVLRRVILYGVSGFDRLGQTLNDIWMPDVKQNQLPGILAGLAPVRSLVNVGSGVKDLIVIPMREYQKDGRIVRSVQKGAVSFAKTTTKELVKLGAKLALGTQTVLQNTEALLAPKDRITWEEEDSGEESGKRISLYADQPLGVVQGLKGAYASLERDLVIAKDAIVAVPGEVIDSGSAGGAAKAVLKQAPTLVLRPAIGVSKAIGQTLLGAGNSLDKQNARRAEEVSHLVNARTNVTNQDIEI